MAAWLACRVASARDGHLAGLTLGAAEAASGVCSGVLEVPGLVSWRSRLASQTWAWGSPRGVRARTGGGGLLQFSWGRVGGRSTARPLLWH